MLNRLTVSALLKTVILATALCVVIGFSLNAWDSWKRLQVESRISVVADVSANLFKAMHNLRTDRSTTNRMLNSDTAMDADGFSVWSAFGLLLHTPDVAERIAAIGEFFLYETILPPAAKALAWLVTARELDCNYVWASGVVAARTAGLDARTHELVRELARLMPVETRTALERYRGGAE